MLKKAHFGHARAGEPCASCVTRSTSRAASSRSVRWGAVAVRRAGGHAVLTSPGPGRLHNLSGGEHDLIPEHWQPLRSPISARCCRPPISSLERPDLATNVELVAIHVNRVGL